MQKFYRVASIILFLFSATSFLFGQQLKLSGLSISVSGGLAIPVGAYKSTNPESSVTTSELGFPRFNGFNKIGNAAALSGYAWNAELKYTLKSDWTFSFAVTNTSNEVETKVINAYLTDQLSFQNRFSYRVNQSDYQVMFYTLGVSKFKHLNNFYVGGGIDVGLGIMEYPKYEVDLFVNSTGNTIPLYHIGFTPDSKSFTFGVEAEAGYNISGHFSTALTVEFRQANFLYEQGLRSVGASADNLFVDTINYRQLLPTLKVCYHF